MNCDLDYIQWFTISMAIEVIFVVFLYLENRHQKKKITKLYNQNQVLKYNLIINGIESPRGFWE